MNDPDSNPYAPQTNINTPYQETPFQPLVATEAYVKQLPVLGVLVIVQGALEAMLALLGIFMVVVMWMVENQAQLKNEFRNAGGGLQPVVMIVVYGVVAVVMTALSIIRIGSGIAILRRKNRMFAIVSTIICVGSVFTCYCAPTSIAICVYAMILLFHPTVERAFALRAEGRG